ncbi:hypothetical protein [Polycladidibacter hongkongensis]|uniref:hypothetical protein n=1 Tax=Polycladidibacter hongkongensis TaxID=1647556 RepID=UPI0008329F55|nr:hypothetical protein [Pseudovibrio hongkongensis]
MSSLANRHYNNPVIGAAFSQLAQAFAPQDPRTALGWLEYQSQKNEQQSRNEAWQMLRNSLSPQDYSGARVMGSDYLRALPEYDLYNRSKEEGARPEDLDASIYAVHGKAPNTFAGQRVGEDAALLKALAVESLKPVAEGETRFIAPEVMQALGISDTEQRGSQKPRSESEVKGAMLGQAFAEGRISSADVARDYKSGVNVETVTGEGGRPELVVRSDAIGQTPYRQPSGGAFSVKNYKLPDGRSGTAHINVNTGEIVDAVTREPLPQGALIGEAKSDGLKDFTNTNVTDRNRQLYALDNLQEQINRGRELLADNPALAGISGSVLRAMQDAAQTTRDLAQYVFKDENGLVTPDTLAQLAEAVEKEGGYDPTFSQYNRWLLSMAYAMASAENPQGEVSRFALERQLEALQGGGLLANSESVGASLDQIERDIGIRRGNLGAMMGGANLNTRQPPDPAPDEEGGVVRFIRGADGKIVRAQ